MNRNCSPLDRLHGFDAIHCCAIGGLVLVLSTAAMLPAENWPGWRGPRGNGTSAETGIPTRWSRTENVAWRFEMPGAAGATPVVWGDRVFLTSADGEDLVLLCVSTGGKELWRRKLGSGNRAVGFGDAEGNYASPSPVTDGRHVWALVGSGDLACFDFEGKRVWEINLQERYGRFSIQFGMSSSPLLVGNRLYLQVIHGSMRGTEEPAYVLAVDKLSGREAWKRPRKTGARSECKHSYASPVLYDNGKIRFLLTHGADYLVAHDLETGAELWRMGGLNGTPGTSRPPRTAGSFLQRFDVTKFDTNRDGRIVRTEIRSKLHQRLFDRMVKKFELDQGKTYTIAEFRKAIGQKEPPPKPKRPVVASRPYHSTLRFVASPVVADGLIIAPSAKRGPVVAVRPQPGLSGNLTGSPKAQTWRLAEGTPDVPSPLIHEGLLYLCSENGNLTCHDAKTGQRIYLERTHRMRHRASPVYADGRIYLTARDGRVTVVRAGRKFEILARNELEEDLAASPAISGGTLYLRTFDALWAIRAN